MFQVGRIHVRLVDRLLGRIHGGGVWLGTLSSAFAAFLYALWVYWYNAKVDDALLIELREHATERRRGRALSR